MLAIAAQGVSYSAHRRALTVQSRGQCGVVSVESRLVAIDASPGEMLRDCSAVHTILLSKQSDTEASEVIVDQTIHFGGGENCLHRDPKCECDSRSEWLVFLLEGPTILHFVPQLVRMPGYHERAANYLPISDISDCARASTKCSCCSGATLSSERYGFRSSNSTRRSSPCCVRHASTR